MMSSILFTKARFAFFSELFDILQYSAVAVTIPSIVPMTNVFFIFLPPDFIVCAMSRKMYGNIWKTLSGILFEYCFEYCIDKCDL